MKRISLILISVFLISTSINAQYKINKTKYNFRTYTYQVGDPYNTALAGIASLLIPGLGQMVSGEGGRGAAFLGGYVGCWIVYGVGAGTMINDIDSGGDGSKGAGAVLLGLGGAIAINIWSIVDAVHVAKVNNLAFRDRNKTGYNIQLQPYFNFSNYEYNNSIPVGVSLKVAF